MIISAIVAVAKDKVIGLDNGIPWYLPADLKYFRLTTLGHHIIMGRKCFESIGRPLPKRTNIIVTRNPFFVASNCAIVHSIEAGLELAQDNGEEEAFIIGGAQIYEQSLRYLDRIYLTEVDLEIKGDVFFPELDFKDWNMILDDTHEKDSKNEFGYTFKIFERKIREDFVHYGNQKQIR